MLLLLRKGMLEAMAKIGEETGLQAVEQGLAKSFVSHL